MFGPFVYARDNDLRQGTGNCGTREEYACELLAELIRRAELLQPLLIRAIEQEHVSRAEYVGALEELARATEMFLGDVGEASVRGQRALLFGLTGSFGRSSVTTDNAPVPEEVARLGGAFQGAAALEAV